MSVTDALGKIVEANTAQLQAFAQYIRERDDRLATIESQQEAIIQALQALRGEVRALSGRSPFGQ